MIQFYKLNQQNLENHNSGIKVYKAEENIDYISKFSWFSQKLKAKEQKTFSASTFAFFSWHRNVLTKHYYFLVALFLVGFHRFFLIDLFYGFGRNEIFLSFLKKRQTYR